MQKLQYGGAYPLSREESQRINVVKFIAIVLVISVHAYDVDLEGTAGLGPVLAFEDLFASILGRSTMPVFFFCSSILLFKNLRTYADVLKTKARTVMLPYFLWNSFWIAVFIAFQTLPFTAAMFSGDSVPILNRDLWGWLNLYGIGAFEPQDYPLWYMRDLILIIFLSPLLWKLVDRFPRATLLGVLISIPIARTDIVLVMGLQYTLLGAYVVKKNIHVDAVDRFPMVWALILYAAAVAFVYVVRLDVLKRTLQLFGVFFWIRVSAGIVGRSRERILKGAQSLFMIYVAHELTLTCFKKLYFKFVPHTPLVVLVSYFLVPALVIALCILADKLTKRFTPRFHALITGGR